jgi:AraC-like DNA-binding protein
MSVTIADSLWLVPAREVLWIPPGVRHTVQFSGRGVLRSLNLQASLCVALSERPRVIAFGRLLRELVRRAIERDTHSLEQIADQPVIALLQVELAAHFAEPALPVDLPLPTDSRAMRAVSFILDDPGASPPIDILAQRSAASARTLARLFVRDTGMTEQTCPLVLIGDFTHGIEAPAAPGGEPDLADFVRGPFVRHDFHFHFASVGEATFEERFARLACFVGERSTP